MQSVTLARHQPLLLWLKVATGLMFLAVLQSGYGQPAIDALKFTIAPDRSEYKLGQPVILTLKLENTGDQPLVVNSRFLVNVAVGPHEVVLQAIGPDKTTLPFESKIRASFNGDRFTTLAPHQAVTSAYDMSNDFELKQPGDYSVRGWYENQSDAPPKMNLPPAWKGTLESNRVQFSLH